MIVRTLCQALRADEPRGKKGSHSTDTERFDTKQLPNAVTEAPGFSEAGQEHLALCDYGFDFWFRQDGSVQVQQY